MGPSRCLRSPAHSRCSGGALEPRKESRLHSSQGNTESADLQRAGRVFPVPEAQDECGGAPVASPGGSVCVRTRTWVCTCSLRPPARQPGPEHSSGIPLGTAGTLGTRSRVASSRGACPAEACPPAAGPVCRASLDPGRKDGPSLREEEPALRFIPSFSVSVQSHCRPARVGAARAPGCHLSPGAVQPRPERPGPAQHAGRGAVQLAWRLCLC